MKEPLTFHTREDFRNWLSEHCLSKDGVWLSFDKTSKQTIKASEALEEALCFGWIDGQMKSIDEHSYVKYFSMRRKNSKWSQKNKTIVKELEKKGLMNDFGRAKVLEAKENGQWDANHEIVVDEEDMGMLMKELKAYEPAFTNYLAMSLSVKKTYAKAFKAPKTMEGKTKKLSWIIDRLNQNLKPM